MPISAIDGCDEAHWAEVKEILTQATEDAGFDANLVSDANDVGFIQARIVKNLYENPVVVCDVSAKNSNVMFELGIRLTFDKPTVIVKDDKTDYSFDTSPIEHLGYPRDLRFSRIVEFKKTLTKKIKATYERSIDDPEYSTFLKHFGILTVPSLETQEVSKEDFIIEELRELRNLIFQRNASAVPLSQTHVPKDYAMVLLEATNLIPGALESAIQDLGLATKNLDELSASERARLVEEALHRVRLASPALTLKGTDDYLRDSIKTALCMLLENKTN